MTGSRICVVGIWHLGAVFSACLADLGYQVVGVDKDPKRVDDLNRSVPPIFEPGLPELLKTNLAANRLAYTTDLAEATRDCQWVWITLDTPVDDNDDVDLTPLFNVVHELSGLADDSVVLVSSQVPAGTCGRIKQLIKQRNPLLDVDVAYSPENLRLGQAIADFKSPRRIVIGADSEATLDKVETLLEVIKAPKLKMNLITAEMTKHFMNAFLATSISLTSEVASLCDEIGADALAIAGAMHLDERIGPGIPLRPGLGFAGGTLARDLRILQKLGRDSNSETRLVDSVLAVNARQNGVVVSKLKQKYGSLGNLTIGVLGLTYKAGTSTLRRAAAIEIIRDLTAGGAQVKAYDPQASLEEVARYKGFDTCDDPYQAAWDADALIIATDWPEFRELDFNTIKSAMKSPVIIDARNMLHDLDLDGVGVSYVGIGRGRCCHRGVFRRDETVLAGSRKRW